MIILKKLKAQIENRPFLFTLGNHDFVDPDALEQLLRFNGIDAYSLHNKIVTVNDFKFYGFPYIPYINGSWNYERDVNSMRREVIRFVNDIKDQGIDVLVAHAPPHGILDKFKGNHIGNNVMIDYLTYKVKREDLPTWYLCGHIHTNCGIDCNNIINVSNAATTCNIIEIH